MLKKKKDEGNPQATLGKDKLLKWHRKEHKEGECLLLQLIQCKK